MASLPFLKFFTGDWIRDTRFLSVDAKGAWIDTLAALANSVPQGCLTCSMMEWSRLWGVPESAAPDIARQLESVAEVKYRDGRVTIANRRLIREELDRERERNKKRGQRDGQQPDWSVRDWLVRSMPDLARLLCPADVPGLSRDCPGDVRAHQRPDSRDQKPEPRADPQRPDAAHPPPAGPAAAGYQSVELEVEGGAAEPQPDPKPKRFALPPPLDALWQAAPPKGRERSSQKALHSAWSRIPQAERPPGDQLLAALEAWEGSDKWARGFVEGVHRWVADRQWLNLPADGDGPDSPSGRQMGDVL